jgi:hypothetical protein
LVDLAFRGFLADIAKVADSSQVSTDHAIIKIRIIRWMKPIQIKLKLLGKEARGL